MVLGHPAPLSVREPSPLIDTGWLGFGGLDTLLSVESGMSSGPTKPTKSISRLRRQRGFRTKPSIGFPPEILKRGDSGLASIEKGLESIDRGASPCRPGCSAVVELFRAVCARELKFEVQDGPAHHGTRARGGAGRVVLCCVVCYLEDRSIDRLRCVSQI